MTEELLVKISADLSDLKKGLDEGQRGFKDTQQAARNSEQSMSSLTDQLSVLNINFGGMGVNVGALTEQFGGAKNAMVAATSSTRAFTVALAATGIGLIVVALGTLVKAFTSTQEGADRMARILEPLKAAFGAIWGVIQKLSIALGNDLVKAFRDPKQAVIDLWEAIKQNLVNRLTGLIKQFQAAGRIIQGVLKLDWNEIKEGAKDYGDAVLQTLTGVEDVMGKIKDFSASIVSEAQRGIAIGKELAALDKQIMKARIAATTELERQRNILAESRRIAMDTEESEEARAAALEKARQAADKIRAIEANILNLELKREKLQASINDTSDAELLTIAEKEAAIIRTNTAYEDQLRTLDRIARSLNKDTEPVEKVTKAVTKKGGETEAVEKIVELSKVAHDFANVLSGQVAEGFKMAFDQEQTFKDFSDNFKKAMQNVIIQLVAATAKALILSTIMSSIPGMNVAGASFGALFKQNMGMGGGQNLFGTLRGADINLSNGRTENSNGRLGY